MSDFQTDGQPYEEPIEAADQTYAQTPPTFSAGLMAQFHENSPLEMLSRYTERSEYDTSGGFGGMLGRALAVGGEGDAVGMPGLPTMAPTQTPTLTADQVNQKYAPIGPDGNQVSITDKPLPEGVAQLVGKAKSDEIEREGIISRFQDAHSAPVNFGTGIAAFMMDPLNAATAFIPGFGEEATAGVLGGGFLARTAGRVVSGATAGAISQAPLVALKYGLGQQEASDYSLRDAFRDVLFSAAGNAVFSAGLGAAGDVLKPGEAPAVPGVETKPETPLSTTLPQDAQTKYDAMRVGVAQIADGKPVDVEPIFDATGPERPEDIIDFLQNRGGVQNESGELSTFDLNRAQKGRFGVLVNKNGLSLDYAREAAEEAGFLPEGSTVSDLLDAIQETSAGNPRFRPEDSVDWLSYQGQRRNYSAPEETDAWNPRDLFSDLADTQQRLHEYGYSPGIPDGDFQALDKEVYEPGSDIEEQEGQPEQSVGSEKPASPEETALAQAETEMTPEKLAAMSPDERAELDMTAQNLSDANDKASAYEEAGLCLGGAE